MKLRNLFKTGFLPIKIQVTYKPQELLRSLRNKPISQRMAKSDIAVLSPVYKFFAQIIKSKLEEEVQDPRK